ncbi:MAG: hypothetical protein F2705_05580, partial [Actinobacteria bacterium]|nr:hypothetical protein [Actinomycetota bacterium]
TELDTDSDGIPNRLDLDSDGDGCNDAKESGTATSTTSTAGVVTAPYGTNGFANSLETTADNGIYTGTYTYINAISNTINACLDTDGDGIPDVIDLDDDNDGILDVIEIPACKYVPVSNDDFGFLGINAAVTSTGTAPVTFGLGDGTAIPAANIPGYAYTWVDGARLTQDGEYAIVSNPRLAAPYWFNENKDHTTQSTGGGGAMLVINAGNPGTLAFTKSLTNLNIGQNYKLSAWISNILGSAGNLPNLIFNIKNASGNVIATLSTGNIATTGTLIWNQFELAFVPTTSSITFELVSNSVSGGGNDYALDDIQLSVCNTFLDTDSDGIPNYLDLDSDGDGCPDAVEAGTTAISSSGVLSTAKLTTSVIPAPYGNNGFANGLETASESGVYKGTYTNSYVLDASFNACTDTDGDGIANYIDIDDDNDGVLDTVESSPYAPCTLNSQVSFVNWGNAVTAANGTGGAVGTITQDGQTITVTWNDRGQQNTTTSLAGLNAASYPAGITGPSKAIQTFQNTTSNTITFSKPVKNPIIYAWSIGTPGGQIIHTFTGTYSGTSSPAKITINPEATGMVVSGANSNILTNNEGDGLIKFSGTFDQISYSTSNTENWAGYSLLVPINSSTCETPARDIDTDADGIPNRLDLDSDGDGCSDAKEAGSSTTATSTTVYPTGTDTNNNGLLNNYEASTAGTINYTSTYTNYALIKTINLCTDTDGDGVIDFFDLDNDNDGVFDAVESPSCFLSATEWNTADKSYFAKFSSQIGSASPNNNFAGLGDGNGTLAAVQLAASQDQINKELFKIELMKPTQLDAIYIKKTSATQIFAATAASLKVQGSNDNTAWTDLTAAIAAPADATNTTVSGAVSLTNSNKFTLTTNPAAYKYFRIYGVVSATTLGGIASEIYVDVNAANYNASRYPKATCTSDSDGDGIPNHLDLDSDNDGCSDANEFYGSASAQGTDGNSYYGTGNPPAVNADGTVTAASHNGTYINATTAGAASIITAQPSNQTLASGANATFSATVTAGSGTTNYQWQVSTDGGTVWANVTNAGVYTGATTSTLTLTGVSNSMNEYRYRLQISQSNY